MESALLFWLSLIVITLIRLIGKLIFAVKYQVYSGETYQIGFSPILFSFNFFRTIVRIGIIIPLPFLFKIYQIDADGSKNKPEGIWRKFDIPLWKRTLTTLGSDITSLLVSIFIFTVLAFITPDQYYSTQDVNKGGVYPSALAQEFGFIKGDRVVSLNGKAYEDFKYYGSPILSSENDNYFTVNRNSEQIKINIPANHVIENQIEFKSFLEPIRLFTIDHVIENSEASYSGLQKGDAILKINDQDVKYFQEFRDKLMEHAAEEVILSIKRGDQIINDIKVRVDSYGKIGFLPKWQIEYTVKNKTLTEAIIEGVNTPFELVALQIKAFFRMFRGEVYIDKQVNGPIGIAKIFPNSYIVFWNLTGMLLVVVVMYNFLPFPNTLLVHLSPLIYEGVKGKAPGFDISGLVRKIFIVIFIILIVFVVATDFSKLF